MNPTIETHSHSLQEAALGLSVLCNLLLANICLNYSSILNSGGIMSSRVDGRGGFWEMQLMVPFLAIVAMAAGVMAAQSKSLKRWGVGLALVSIVLWLGPLTLVYYIHTSPR